MPAALARLTMAWALPPPSVRSGIQIHMPLPMGSAPLRAGTRPKSSGFIADAARLRSGEEVVVDWATGVRRAAAPWRAARVGSDDVVDAGGAGDAPLKRSSIWDATAPGWAIAAATSWLA